MYVDIFNKVLILLLCIASLNTLRHGYYFIQAWALSDEENPIKYRLANSSLLLLNISIAYIITSIISCFI